MSGTTMSVRRGRRKTMLVNVKLAPDVDRKSSLRILSSAPGVVNVMQTFPGETDNDLSGLFLLEVDSTELLGALTRLRQDPAIEYAEEAAPRRLIK